jgi:hypothetical protein
MVAPHQDLPARPGIDPGQIDRCILQGTGPGQVAREQDGIPVLHHAVPGGGDPGRVLGPVVAENIHRLVPVQGQVQIGDGEQPAHEKNCTRSRTRQPPCVTVSFSILFPRLGEQP